ncbi:phage virion morphogenesis protein [Novosphingobium guangzhouense]|uniref:Phage virion morphogenesis protein n=2 Tax=Novosphingobium guangzhouense TaxID=1850347 RepID=A0A2K2G613_9SPHN|nr:phage virion morphogenesis protein [Novosphingobium guangzhouense]
MDEWFGQILAGMAPAERRKAALKLGQALRRSNLKRVADNVEPDGRPMVPRKPRLDRPGKLRKRQSGKMFKGLRKLRNWKIIADAEGVTIAPAGGNVDRVASVSHYGEVATVGYLRGGAPIRARYPVRRILGFAPDDEHTALEIAASLLQPEN